jgi:hypothetical protein
VNPPAILVPRHAATGGGVAVPAPPHTPLVYALDGVRFVASAASRRALMQRVAQYVEQNAGERLWAGDARRVRQLVGDGAHEEAVELYFALVGERWDEEWIVVTDPSAS